MKTFEFEQLGKTIRIEVEYNHKMNKEEAWLDGDVVEMPSKPHESCTAKVYANGMLKYKTNRATAYWLKLSDTVKEMKGYPVRTIHDLELAIIEPKVWEAYTAWINEVIEEGTTDEVKEYLNKKQEEKDALEVAEAKRIVKLAESQKDIPSREEANRQMKWWNDTYNEGGEGIVPEIISKDQYGRAKEIIRKKGK